MKARHLCPICFVWLIALAACRSTRTGHEGVSVTGHQEVRLPTQAQMFYLRRYAIVRKRVTNALYLPETAGADDIRPHAARFLHLPESASWNDMLSKAIVKAVLTDERRIRFATIFGLPKEASWISIHEKVETMLKMPH